MTRPSMPARDMNLCPTKAGNDPGDLRSMPLTFTSARSDPCSPSTHSGQTRGTPGNEASRKAWTVPVLPAAGWTPVHPFPARWPAQATGELSIKGDREAGGFDPERTEGDVT